MAAKPARIKCLKKDQVFLRLLGGAVVKQWDQLATSIQGDLLNQASLMIDPEATTKVQLKQQVESFIKKHKDD